MLVIGLDTAEYSLIEKWSNDGSLPIFKELLTKGSFGLLESYASYLPGSNWYSFYLSQQPGVHGLYSHFSWRAEKMKTETPSSDWVSVSPFWSQFHGGTPRGLVINVPNAFMTSPFNGIELLSLASDHMMTSLQSNPKYYSARIAKELKRIHYHEEKYDIVTLKEFLQTRDEMIELTHTLKDLSIRMMLDEVWDVMITVLPAVHRAGHRLWSNTNIRDIKTQAEKDESSDALKQVYIASDRAIGELLKAAGEDCISLIFSTHGMTHNHSREVILPEMLHRVLNPNGKRTVETGFLKRIRGYIPLSLRHKIKALLPLSVRKKITLFWRLGLLDWRKTPAFVLPLEVRVGIRINLKGREARGIVSPGGEYEELCQVIMKGLKTFIDADTGKPLIKELVLAKDVFEGERVGWLPDIVGSWNEDSAAEHRLIVSPEYGNIPWPTPGHNPEGRSGNHANIGFLMVHGKEILPGEIRDAHIIDLAPTIFSLLGKDISPEMQGKVLEIPGLQKISS
ncbi:MAG: alkaline phosphatase family protein [Anaerolineales bacterium]|nr:alkaline phosphatase family protein [Anaerolineales bacterium]